MAQFRDKFSGFRMVWRALLLAFGLGIAMPTPAQESTAELGPTTDLSARSMDSQHPAVAASPDGRHVVVVWDGVVDGSRRIFLREKVEGIWLPERIVDAEPLAENRNPVVAVDDASNIHVAWLGTVDGQARVFYASSVAGRLTSWGVLDESQGSGEQCGKVVLRLDPEGQPWLAWESGRGTRVSIRCARLEEGAFVVENLTPQAQNHNWFPEIFFTPAPLVTWYADQIPDFALRAATYSSESRSWQPVSVRGADQIPNSSLPQLVRRGTGELVACWIEDLSEAGSARTDYVLISEPGESGGFTPRPVEFETHGTKESLARTVVGDRLVLAWCAKSLEEGWQIYVASGSTPPFVRVRVTDGSKDGYYDQPSVTGLPAGVAAVWSSSESFGGNGRILYRELRF